MKKNLITVIILALCVVNLILNVMIVFVCMPSAKKTNTLITEIASVLNLELESEGEDQPKVALKDMKTYDVEAQVVNLKDGGDVAAEGEGAEGEKAESHYVQLGLTLGLDGASKDYEDLNAVLSAGSVFDVARNIIQNYTFEEVKSQEVQEDIKKQILEGLQEKYGTQCIYSVSFSKFTVQ
ncbi:MAG: flagellar basal body-associated FliL family protein [Clostridium sp.]|nr:flagellar basal body-associated FliL family protein [Clostridium sp.]